MSGGRLVGISLVGCMILFGGIVYWAMTDHKNNPRASTEFASPQQTPDAPISKSDEVAQAKRGPTAQQIAGNANKWTGTYVRFPCKIINVVSGPAANATCGQGVTAKLDFTPKGDVDYSDPDAVQKQIREAQESTQRQMAQIEDQAMIVLTGDAVSNFDGGQVVTITGKVLGTQEGKNAMGATLEFPTVQVDFTD